MKLLLSFCAIASFAACAFGLSCISCTGQSSIAKCDAKKEYEVCSKNQICQTIVRRHNGRSSVTKGCKQENACHNNMRQNLSKSGKSFQCNKQQQHSVCTCCCDGEKCNKGRLNCAKNTYKPVARTLPAPPTTKPTTTKAVTANCPVQNVLPHGEITCSDANKPGSTCAFKCAAPYSLYPANVDTNQCNVGGKWNKPRPCCARPCPPFLLFDAAILYHSSDQRSLPIFPQIREATIGQNIDVNYDTAKFSGFYFNHKPVLSTRYNYSEYETKEELLQLIEDRIIPARTVAGIVNVGRAMWFAINYMFRANVGARYGRVPNMMVVVLDANSTDNVKAPSEAALRDGIVPYVFAIEHEGSPLNRTQMAEIAGTKDRVYYVNGDNPNIGKFIDDLKADFCEDPCDHVLHDHDA